MATAKAAKATTKPVAAPAVVPADDARPRPRSPNHPALSLEDAVAKAKLLYDKYLRVPVAMPLACLNWKYTNPRSSGALQTLATLRAYGLIEVSGRSDAQKVTVTDAAERIIRGAPTRAELLRVAAIAPAIHSEVWNNFDRSLPHDELLRNYLLWERPEGSRFTDDSVDGFIARLRSTLRYAGLIPANGAPAGEQNQAHVDTPKNGNGLEAHQTVVRVGSHVQWTSAGVDQFSRPQKVVGMNGDWAFVESSKTGIPMSELTAVDQPAGATAPPSNPYYKPADDDDGAGASVAREQCTLDEGPVVLTWPPELSKESVAEFEYWLAGIARRARRKAGLPAEPGKGEKASR